MIIVAIREIVVLLFGCVLALVGSLIVGNANRDFAALVTAIVIPIVFCLIRVTLVKRPDSALSGFRHFGYQLCLGFAFVLLLLFETLLGLFWGAADIPAVVWWIVGGFGMGYVLFSSVASRVGSTGDQAYDRPLDVGAAPITTRPPNRYVDEPGDATEWLASSRFKNVR